MSQHCKTMYGDKYDAYDGNFRKKNVKHIKLSLSKKVVVFSFYVSHITNHFDT